MCGLIAHNRKASILVLDNGAEFVPGLDADTGGSLYMLFFLLKSGLRGRMTILAFYPICCSVSTKRCIPQNMNTKTIGGKGDTGKDEIREALNHSARAGGERFFPAEGSENNGILYGFPVFGTARMGEKLRCPAAAE